jgi:hypothetical protein
MTCRLVAATWIGLFASCLAPSFPAHALLEGPGSDAAWVGSDHVPPSPPDERRRVLLRGVLGRGGTELECTLVLELERPDRMRLVALNDLGGVLFHVLRGADGSEVLQASPYLDPGFLADVLAEDLATVFLGVPAERVRPARTELGAPAWHGRAGESELLFVPAAGPGSEPDRLFLGSVGHLRTTVWFDEWVPVAAGNAREPRRLTLEGASGGWRLELEALTEAARS